MTNKSAAQSPFEWDIKKFRNERVDMIKKLAMKASEVEEDRDFKIRQFTLDLLKAYEMCEVGEIKAAVDEVDALVLTLGFLATSKDKLYGKIKNGVKHVVYATKYHVYEAAGRLEEAESSLSAIENFDTLDIQSRACIWGLRSMILSEYGMRGTKAAIEWARMASEADPENGQWLFNLGKMLKRVRRNEFFFDLPSQEEVDSFMKACQVDPNYIPYMLHTAEMWKEVGKVYHSESTYIHRNSVQESKSRAAIKKSFEFYMKCYELVPNPSDSHICFRLAKGLWSLPRPYKNINLAQRLICRGLELSGNNPYGMHLWAMFLERTLKDKMSAMTFYKSAADAGVWGAKVDLIKMEFERDPRINVITRLEEMMKDEEASEDYANVSQLLEHMLSYYFFHINDMKKVAEIGGKLFDLNISSSNRLKRHQSWFLKMRNPVSLMDIVIDEIRLIMERKTTSVEDRVLYDNFLQQAAKTGYIIPVEKPTGLRQKTFDDLYDIQNPSRWRNPNNRRYR